MTPSFEVVHPDAPFEQVAARLETHGDRSFLVCEHGRLIGVLDLEVIRGGGRKRGDGARAPRARDAVAPDVLYCLESTDLAEAAALMREHRVHSIPVLDVDGRPVGVVALDDALTASRSARPD
ncbi:MAG: CBS domain-containing protein [Candidatus Eiseniibacteriota bacterium]